MTQPTPVQEVLDGSDRTEQGRQPPMVEVAERSRPAVVDGDEPSEQMGHERHLPDEYPQLVHNTGKFGDKVVAVSSKFVDKAVVAP
jgi:hypothetical protein